MTKLEQAARQLLRSFESGMIDINLITALREALDHSGEATDMVGCAYCNNPIFAGTKCNNCGRVTLAEQAEQEPVAWIKRIPEQDYWETTSGDAPPDSEGYTPLYASPVRTKDLTDAYYELIYAVGSKFPNESRHETALRYIRQAEQGDDQACSVIAANREKNK